ncbi:MAG: erythromycin esterase family protein [Planctomycetota bacterium]|nr:erythromycin esterase family protein [Planctomycetota bacterium]
MKVVHFALALLAITVFEDTPKPVVDWFAEAKKHAVSPQEIVARPVGEASARVVMVGRAFAGTAELARFEGTIAACATANDVLALDCGYREGEELERWVRTGVGDVDKLLADCHAFGWNVSAARTWLTDLSKREAKPKLVGIATGDPRAACTEVLSYISKVDPDALPRAEHALRPLSVDGRNGEAAYFQLDDNQRVVLRLALEETLGLFRDAEAQYTTKSSAAEFAGHSRLLIGLSQYEEVMRFERDNGEHDPRGRIMAENALVALKNRPETGRLFAFVGLRDLARASDADSFAAQFKGLGGEPFVAVATACGSAEFLALDPNATTKRIPRALKISLADAGPLERAFAHASGDAAWILDLRVKPADANVTAWFAEHRSLRSADDVCGAASETPWDHEVLVDFDAIAWFPTLSR